MNFDNKFDYEDQQYWAVDHLLNEAWNCKEDLVKAPTLQKFSLSGLTSNQVVEIQVVGGDRISMPSMPTERRTFDSRSLLIGIFAGDSSSANKDEIIAYYPHVREGKLIGKSVFTMNLAEAAILIQKSAKALGIDTQKIMQQASGVDTKYTMTSREQIDLHMTDIFSALAKQLQASNSSS